MFLTYYGMHLNPFRKEIETKHLFQSKDLKRFLARMEYFKTVLGFGLVYGEPGCGKSTSLRAFTASLNPQLFRVVYLPLTSATLLDFYRHLAVALGLIPTHRKVDLFHQIQEHVANLSWQKNVTPLIIIDEAQFLHHKILDDLRLLFNFQMDSKNYAMVLLAGQPCLVGQLNLHVHEALRQRIIVHYEFTGLELEEVEPYVASLLKTAGAIEPIFTPDAFSALASSSAGLPRKISTLVEKALLLGFQKQLRSLDADIIQAVYDETQICLA